jgi:putative inorganic carbon (hco3(-)) transporter
MAELLALRARTLWQFFRAQNLAFWAMCFYLVVEYVRPQQMFAPIYGAPLGKIGLGVAVLALLLSGRFFVMKGPATWLFIAFTGVILMSSSAAFDSTMAFQEFRELWLPWILVFFLIISVVDTEPKFLFFVLLWLMCHYYMSQGGFKQFAFRGFRFAPWGITGQPGWFHNSGEFAIAMCMLAAVSWHFYQAAKPYLSKWRKVFVLGMPFTASMSVLGSSSRGAVLALGAVGFWILLRTKHRVRAITAIVVLGVVGWVVLPAEQKARFSSAGEDVTSVRRLIYWKAGLKMAQEHPVLGIGFGNWVPYYRAFYKASDDTGVWFVQVSHNIFIQCMAELGYTGLLIFVALIVATLVVNSDTRKRASRGPDPPNNFIIQMSIGLDSAMVSYLVAGFFVTVLYYPFFWVNLAFTVALNSIARRQRAAPAAMMRGTQAPARRVTSGGRVSSAR